MAARASRSPCVGVEGLTVVAQLRGGPGERLRDAAPEHVLQQRQHLAAEADAGETGVDVVRVVPEGQALRPARRRPCPRAADRAAAAARVGPRSACRPATGLLSRGRGRAARSRPGHRGCGRAGRASRGAGGRCAGRRTGRGGRPPRDRRRRPRPRRAPRRNALSGQIGDERGAACGGALLQPVVDHRDMHPAGCDGPGRGERAVESAPPEQATSSGPRAAARQASSAGAPPDEAATAGGSRRPGRVGPGHGVASVTPGVQRARCVSGPGLS